MWQSISKEQALAQLSPGYHLFFDQIYQTRIRPHDQIYAAINSTVIWPRPEKHTSCHAGFCLVTTQSLLIAASPSGFTNGIRYYNIGANLGGLLNSPTDHRYLLNPTSEEGREFVLSNYTLAEIQLGSIKNIGRKDFKISHKNQQHEIIELSFYIIGNPNQRWLAMSAKDGQIVYDLIKNRIGNDSILKSSNEDISKNQFNIPELIASLAKLRDAGVLSSEEFDQKKKELLKRL